MYFSAYFQAVDPRSAIRVSSGQRPNACDPIFVTDEGIVILSRKPQRTNASSPISVTEEGIVILSRKPQPENAPSPISVTEEGIVNEVLPPGQMTRTFRSFE